MKTKRMRKLAMLLAISIFMTQVSYFPAKAAGISVEEQETETETEAVAESEATEETQSVAETQAVTDCEVVTESEIVTEAEVITESESQSGTASETEVQTATETEAVTETETAVMTEEEASEEYLHEDGDMSLSGISFTFTDLRDLTDSDSDVLNTDDGKQAVYLFGSFTTCSNTSTAVSALSKCVEYYDKDKLNIYVFNIMPYPDVNRDGLVSWLNNNKVSNDITVGWISSSSSERNFYQTCFEKTVGDSIDFTMPVIVYKGTDSKIYKYTTGRQTESDICKNIEAGGLKKITETEEEKEGELYVISNVNYDMAYEILDIVNAERQKEGLPALVMDKDLLDAAMQRAVECEVFYNHTRPNGQSCMTACSGKMNGENIAWGYTSAEMVMSQWMGSEGHRANILRSEFQSIGIGVSDAGGRLAFTQCFGVGAADEIQKPSNITSKTYTVRYVKSRITPSLTKNSVTLNQGDTHFIVIKAENIPYYSYADAIKCESYTWKSSDETVATVEANGTVKAVSPGNATITGTNVLNQEDTLALEVTVKGDTRPKLNVEYHTVDEIEAYLSKSGVTGKEVISYKSNPVTSGDYSAGELSADTLNSAVAALNQIRYIAGISHDITVNSTYNELCQAASFVNYVNDVLTHYPTQPSGMPDDLYQLGAQGARRSNLSWASYSSNFYQMLNGQLADEDNSNVDRVGHRRWLLNPVMKQTGFGAVGGPNGTYGAVYAFDNSQLTTDKKVAWPAQTTPTTYFSVSDPWSISLAETVNMSTTNVTLTRDSDNKQWKFSTGAADGYFNVNNDGYGQTGCIIFRPAMTEKRYADGDLFHVSITYNGNQKLEYEVLFFEPFKTYSITYELNDGVNDSGNPDSFRVFSDTIVLKEPVKEYSRFDGWYTDSSFKNRITQIEKGTNKDIKLYAKWNDIVTKITLNESSVTIKEGQTLQLNAQITSDENINEVTWKSSDETVATVDGNGLVTAKSAGTAAITATSYGKQAVCDVKVVGTTKAPAANIPTNTEVGKGTLITLTSDTPGAVIRYTTDGSVPTEKSKVYKEAIAINEDTTIMAYASSKENEDSAVVTFVYTLKSFTVTFDSDGGSAVSPLKVYQNDTADEPDQPVKEGYNFVGWYLNGKPYDFGRPVTADLTLKAVWKEYDALPAPTASLKSEMVVETGTRIALSHEISGVTIYYTTNGSTPTAKSTEYKKAIVINTETTIKAIAVKAGYKNSETATFHYTVAEKGSLWGDVSPEDIPGSGNIPSGIWITGIADATYTGAAVTHNIRVYDGSTLLVEKKDYTVSYKNNVKAAKKTDEKAPTVIISGKGNYTGTRNITLTVTEKTLISKASVTKIPNQVYDGKDKLPEITVKLKKELEPDKDYTLSYEGNREIGTASVIVKGKGEYAGTKRVSFKIVSPYKGGKYDIDKDEEKLIDVDMDSRATFLKGGSTPTIRVSFDGKRLVQGKDYTVSFKDNKAAYAVSKKEATAIITGKGNYCGKITKNFQIEEKDISKTILLVNDKVYTGKEKGHVTKFTLTDTDGKALKAGTDYEKEVTYTYANATTLEGGGSRKAGEAVTDTDIIPVGTTIKVTVKGTGSYVNTITGEYRVIAKENDISKAKVTLKNPQYYTGDAVEPDENQFEVTLAGTALQSKDFSIVGYTNNTKKGNATVTIRGEGTYGGTKTAKFAIGSRTVEEMKME